MNICVIGGELTGNAIVRGKQTRAMVFTVRTTHPNGESGEDALTSHVPCVVFNPPEALEQKLCTKGKGLRIELEGRVNASRREPEDEPRSNAEVVVYTRSVRIEDSSERRKP